MLKNHEITTRAVVVSRTSQGEGSVRIFLYTERAGLITASAKSAREERSKLRPHLQVGTLGLYTVVRGEHEWKVIGATDTKNNYFSFAENEPAQRASSRVVTLIKQLIHGEDVNEDLFRALWNFLQALAPLEKDQVSLAERLAVVRILRALGYVPPEKMIPHLDTPLYTPEVLRDTLPHKKKLVVLINDALSASGLL